MKPRAVSLAFACALAAAASAAIAISPLPRGIWMLPAFGCVAGIFWERGGRRRLPATALNIAALPDQLPAEVSSEILRGGAEKAREAGVVIAGGHTVKDKEPKYGRS